MKYYHQEFFHFNTFFPRLNDGMGILLSRTPSYVDVDLVNFRIFKTKCRKYVELDFGTGLLLNVTQNMVPHVSV